MTMHPVEYTFVYSPFAGIVLEYHQPRGVVRCSVLLGVVRRELTSVSGKGYKGL